MAESETDSGSDREDCDRENVPPPSKRKKLSSIRKWSGATIYKSQYQTTWQRKWPFLLPVKDNPNSCHCSICKKHISCAHQGERDVLRHIETASHQKNARAIQNIQPLSLGDSTSVQLLKEKVSNHIVQYDIMLICLCFDNKSRSESYELLSPAQYSFVCE